MQCTLTILLTEQTPKRHLLFFIVFYIICLIEGVCQEVVATGLLLKALSMGIEGILAQALIIGVSTPSALNSAILAKEFDK